MRRGDIITIVQQGDYGKPRPALIIQSDLFAELPSITILPLTTHVREDLPLFRITLTPDSENGLKSISQIMIDKSTSVPKEKAGNLIGRVNDEILLKVNRALLVFLNIA
jgi:mRNA interferase MazF